VTFGSLFSGIGGFDLGLERAGWACAWQVERDRHCNAVLARRWPSVERYDDVRTVGADLAPVDCICGGFPCQDLSVAGRRAGLAGERSGLWHEFHRILGCARPRWCIIENVPGLLSSNRGADFAVVLRGLVELGYGVCWRVLDAQYMGLAQRRKRVFVVGCLGGGTAATVLFEPESVSWNPPPRRAPREGAAPTLEARTRGSGGGWGSDFTAGGGLAASPVLASQGHHGHSSPHGDGRDNLVAFNLRSRDQGNVPEVEADGLASVRAASGGSTRTMVAGAVRSNMRNNSDPVTEANALIPFDTTQVTQADNRSPARPGAPCHPLAAAAHVPAIAWALQERDAKGSDSDTKDGHLLVADPLVANEGGTYTHEGSTFRLRNVMPGVRRLTPRECERLQGFPDDWTDGQSDSVRYRQLGNAVAVPVAEWIGRRLAREHVPSGEV
jgi:DNA (cytosine-5)-methyltransferase 1